MFAAILMALPCAADALLLPSGRQVYLQEIISETGGDTRVTRLRYIADSFAPDGLAPDVALKDLTFICQNKGLPILTAPTGGQTVIVSLADRAAPFGVIDSSVAQIFEVFTVLDTSCIWEAF